MREERNVKELLVAVAIWAAVPVLTATFIIWIIR